MIVVPTYEEALTISDLLRGLLAQTSLTDFHVLVVDDASPDGTATIVGAHPEFGTRVHLLNRPGKAGLGAAYRAGFNWARTHGYDVVVQMDADGSHPADAVPRLVAALQGADLVVGSRYVRGGRTVDWPWHRRMISSGGNLYVRLVLGLPVRDCTAGFRAYRREALALLVEEGTHADGYSFQIETTWLAARRDMRVVEVPITFVERRAGHSKMSTAIAAEALWRVVMWRVRDGRASSRRMQEQPA
ncbi:glycosyltransferase [Nocardioides sp. MAH-18]|uniref:Glycosyltransferase n=1 Tax=Nocardioides agri TaxID=2682843 RepID=A0A6L6XPI5_9ACTN|nr:polyprenol monophosphomannose synthase [Nocardioides sp. MAH-18]MBA2953758.1 polyprenol monophosphomannose synthase [Nocardioides sp. CGMCC 1.13656]MVQ48623.1 glycosyltransferase [Nocardioides sp. MAH-18]